MFFSLLLSCSVTAQSVFPLYGDSIPNNLVELQDDRAPTLTIYKPTKEKANGKAIIVMPGGAYMFLATSTEGTPIAKAFTDSGYTAFVLKYRLPSDQTMRDKSIGPLQDAQAAIRLIRMRSVEWNIDTNKVGVIGFSAGGHLASTLGTQYTKGHISNPENISLRPDYMILVYPVISMEKPLTHNGSRNSLIGRDPSQLLVDLFSNEKQVTSSTPPTYLTHTADDRVVHVNNSIVFYKALQENNVNVEMHLFPKGNHGFTQKMGVKEWLNPMLMWLASIGQ